MSLRNLARQWVIPFFDPRRIWALTRLPRFLAEFRQFRRLAPRQNVRFADLYPCLDDRVASTPFDPHYFYQAAWLARRLAASKPTQHTDVGSSVNMVAVLSAHQPMTFLDYRPLRTELSGLECIAGSATALPFADDSVESLSCLHVIEHIGLARYGDPLDPQGSATACTELQRSVKRDGRLYLSVPVGRERVCFNAHRVFAPASIVALFPKLRLVEFSLVDDAGEFHQNVALERAQSAEYGCGLFEFVKDT